jgi:hypothetical protein
MQQRYGGVGVPVGLTVFKTAGGSLGAVPGGFNSHTPLPSDLVYIFYGYKKRITPLQLVPHICYVSHLLLAGPLRSLVPYEANAQGSLFM